MSCAGSHCVNVSRTHGQPQGFPDPHFYLHPSAQQELTKPHGYLGFQLQAHQRQMALPPFRKVEPSALTLNLFAICCPQVSMETQSQSEDTAMGTSRAHQLAHKQLI